MIGNATGLVCRGLTTVSAGLRSGLLQVGALGERVSVSISTWYSPGPGTGTMASPPSASVVPVRDLGLALGDREVDVLDRTRPRGAPGRGSTPSRRRVRTRWGPASRGVVVVADAATEGTAASGEHDAQHQAPVRWHGRDHDVGRRRAGRLRLRALSAPPRGGSACGGGWPAPVGPRGGLERRDYSPAVLRPGRRAGHLSGSPGGLPVAGTVRSRQPVRSRRRVLPTVMRIHPSGLSLFPHASDLPSVGHGRHGRSQSRITCGSGPRRDGGPWKSRGSRRQQGTCAP